MPTVAASRNEARPSAGSKETRSVLGKAIADKDTGTGFEVEEAIGGGGGGSVSASTRQSEIDQEKRACTSVGAFMMMEKWG